MSLPNKNYVEHLNDKVSTLFTSNYVLVDRLIIGLSIFIAFFILAAILGRIFRNITARHNARAAVTFGRLVRNVLIILGVFAALSGAGVHLSTFIASIGLWALAVGYGMQYIFANLGAGFMIMLSGQIRKGDHITIYGSEGTVTNITLRYTTLQNGENTVLVPNNLFSVYPMTKIGKE